MQHANPFHPTYQIKDLYQKNQMGFVYNELKIETERLCLRPLRPEDCAKWVQARTRNYDHLQKWEPIWDIDHLSYVGFNRILGDSLKSFDMGNYYSMSIFRKEDEALLGHIEIANIMGWPKSSAVIGYWIDEAQQGKGYMTEAVRGAVFWCFSTLRLRRVEAATMLSNKASQRVLLKSGFSIEGIEKDYGEINGKFEDHYIFGIVARF